MYINDPYNSGAEDYKCIPNGDLLSDAKDLYAYRRSRLVDKDYKHFADAVITQYGLSYPPSTHEDVLYRTER